jgi:SWI/SNF-related matrix-associated actin-dependent regulator of chromatin subfamily A member 5
MLIDDDIDEIIKRGEDKTAELQSKYQGLDLDALNNFKSESMVNQWEGEDFGNGNKVSCNPCVSLERLTLTSAKT